MSETRRYHVRVAPGFHADRLTGWLRAHGVRYGQCELVRPPYYYFACTREQAALLSARGYTVTEGFPLQMCV